MTSEFIQFHGIVFGSLIHASQRAITVQQHHSPDNASYVVDRRVGVYVKYSTKRLSPWQFTFEKRHKMVLTDMAERYSSVVIALVCRNDGVAGMTMSELSQVIDLSSDPSEGLSLVRRPREKYLVRGSQGELKNKIGMNDFCEKVLAN